MCGNWHVEAALWVMGSRARLKQGDFGKTGSRLSHTSRKTLANISHVATQPARTAVRARKAEDVFEAVRKRGLVFRAEDVMSS